MAFRDMTPHAGPSVVVLLMVVLVACGEDSGVLSPGNSRAWTQRTSLGSRFGGAVLATPDDRLVVRTSEGELLRSLDGGDSWTPANLDGHIVGVIARGGSTIFASAYGTDGRSTQHIGLFTSVDWGQSWRPIGFEGLVISAITAFGSRVYVGVRLDGDRAQTAELYGSTDLGVTWSMLGRGWQSVRSISVTDRAVFVSDSVDSTGQLLRSTDGGASWTNLLWNRSGAVQAIGDDVIVSAGGSLSPGWLPPTPWRYSPDRGASWVDEGGPASYQPPLLVRSAIYAVAGRNDGGGNDITLWTRTDRPAWSRGASIPQIRAAWRVQNLDFPGQYSKAMVASDIYLYALTRDGMVYRTLRPA